MYDETGEPPAYLVPKSIGSEEMLDGIMDGFLAVDADWRVTAFNRAAEGFFEMSRSDIVGRGLFEVMPSVPGDVFEARYRRCMAERVVEEFQIGSRVRPGKWLEVRAFPLGDGIGVAFRDMTEHRASYRKSFAGGAKLQAVFDQASVGMAEFDREGRFVMVNDRYCGMVGRSRTELVGTLRMQDVAHSDDLPDIERLFTGLLDGGESLAVEQRYVRPDGSVIWANDSVTGIRDGTGAIVSVLAVSVDVSAEKAAKDEMRESAKRLRLALDAGGMAVWEFVPQTSYVTWSPALVRLFGYPEGSQPDLDEIRDRYLPGERDRLIKMAEQAIAQGERYAEIDFRYRRPDGAVRWLSMRVDFAEALARPGAAVLGVLSDVTARREAVELVRSNETRMRLAQEASGVGTYEWDFVSGQLTWSREMYALYGLDTAVEGAAIYPAWLETLHPDDRERADAETRGFLDRLDPFEILFRVVRPDGYVRWIHGRGRVERDPDGNPLAMRGVNIDVTERRRGEEALLESERMKAAILEAAMDPIVTIDGGSRVVEWNAAAEATFGYSRREAIGADMADLIMPAETRERHRAGMRRHLAVGGGDIIGRRVEVEAVHADGRRIPVELAVSAIEIGGEPHFTAYLRDIGARRAFERGQRLMINELNHRVKNTLALVQAISSQTLRHGQVSQDVQRAFESRLIALSGAHDVLTRESWASVDLLDLVKSSLAPHVVGEGRVRVTGQPIRLKPKTGVLVALALHELATNALKYGALSAPSGSIEIEWTVTDGRFRLVWRERGGPVVSAPSQRGFGSRLIEQALAAEIAGDSRILFEPDGVVYRLDAGIGSMVEEAE